jgi:hypothetical protein
MRSCSLDSVGAGPADVSVISRFLSGRTGSPRASYGFGPARPATVATLVVAMELAFDRPEETGLMAPTGCI